MKLIFSKIDHTPAGNKTGVFFYMIFTEHGVAVAGRGNATKCTASPTQVRNWEPAHFLLVPIKLLAWRWAGRGYATGSELGTSTIFIGGDQTSGVAVAGRGNIAKCTASSVSSSQVRNWEPASLLIEIKPFA
jgi:hypothetical protein